MQLQSHSHSATARYERNKALSVCIVETLLRAGEAAWEAQGDAPTHFRDPDVVDIPFGLDLSSLRLMRSVFHPTGPKGKRVKARKLDDMADAMLQAWQEARLNWEEMRVGALDTAHDGHCICTDEMLTREFHTCRSLVQCVTPQSSRIDTEDEEDHSSDVVSSSGSTNVEEV